MTTEQLLESEKDQLQDYLYGYCDNPLATADNKLENLFWYFDITDAQDIRWILESAEKVSYFNYCVPSQIDYSIMLNIAEIEIEAEYIEPNELDEYTIIGNMAYYYVGYGLIFEYNRQEILSGIIDLIGE